MGYSRINTSRNYLPLWQEEEVAKCLMLSLIHPDNDGMVHYQADAIFPDGHYEPITGEIEYFGDISKMFDNSLSDECLQALRNNYPEHEIVNFEIIGVEWWF